MQKTALIYIRVTPQEKEKLNKQAKKAGFDTLSAYVLFKTRGKDDG